MDMIYMPSTLFVLDTLDSPMQNV